ncbi:MAG: SRPBCC family protein [Polyangiales bacterium]
MTFRKLALSSAVTLLFACDGTDLTSSAVASAPEAAQQAQPAPRNRQIALGRAHGCSLDAEISGVVCWGDNGRGQARVPPLTRPRFVAAGGDTSCAVAARGVTCWGDDAKGQRKVPAGLGTPTQLTVGEGHVCALREDGTVTCWGDDGAGQLRVPALRGVRRIVAGARHTCALSASGVVCWGDAALGQVAVPALVSPTLLAAGGAQTCAVDAAEGAAPRVVCWGGEPAVARDVPTLTAPSALAVGGAHACVVDGERVRCWGAADAPVLAPRELTRPTQVALGGTGFGCARHLQGVACWGEDTLGQARYVGGPLHLMYRAEAEIRAPADKVWAILMDLPNYGKWNPYTTAMQSTLQIGAPMVMTVKMNALTTLTQTEYIRVLEPGHKACWGIDTTTPEANSGERCQWLEPLPDGGTRYVTEDLIEGSLNGLVSGLFDADLKRGFDGVARGLKAHAELTAGAR